MEQGYPSKSTNKKRPLIKQLFSIRFRPVIFALVLMALVVGVASAYIFNRKGNNLFNVADNSKSQDTRVVQAAPRDNEPGTEGDKVKETDEKRQDTETSGPTKLVPTATTPSQPSPKPLPSPVTVVSPAPATYVKPNSSNTGPRHALTRTLTPDQALTELRSTNYLSKVRITGRLELSGSDGRNWIVEDSVIEASGQYGIHAYSSIGSFTGTLSERPIFRHVEVIGRAALGNGNCGAVVYGSNIVIQYADLYGCDDSVKASSNVSLISSWLHDNDHPSGAHCDSLQIRSGTNILIAGNRFDAYVGYSSDGSQVPDGATCSGGLQTGSITNYISARFENNWFAGGHYTIRGYTSAEAPMVSYVFKNNKWMRYGTSVALGVTNLVPNRYGPVTATLGDFDASNVWEDTGVSIRN